MFSATDSLITEQVTVTSCRAVSSARVCVIYDAIRRESPSSLSGGSGVGYFHHTNDRHVYLQEQDVRSSPKCPQEIEIHVQRRRWDGIKSQFRIAPG